MFSDKFIPITHPLSSSLIQNAKVQKSTHANYYIPAVVDIMPSIARFLNISIPLEISRELDGIPLIGEVSLAEVEVHHFQNQLDITWKPLQTEGQVKIWVSTTNACKEGGREFTSLWGR